MNSEDAAFDAALTQLLAGSTAEQPEAPSPRGLELSALWQHPEPQLLPVPTITRGFRIRIDLQHTKPPVWRRIEVPGDITLPRLHEVLQAAMGWFDCHLHQFRTSNERNPPRFATQFDLDEGDEGMLEDEVRLDQIVAAPRDLLWYDYDFGDGWEHILRVEQVLDTPPETPRCTAGRLACPPEDCGGIWGYHRIAQWVRSGFSEDLRPDVFESAEDGRDWLPPDWHPDVLDLTEVNEMITKVSAEPPPVTEEFASLLSLERSRGARNMLDTLTMPMFHEPAEVSTEDAARLTEPFRALLQVIGDGTHLTAAGYLKPVDVEQVARLTGISGWWIGKANREDQTWPVAELRALARSLGLVTVRKGRILPTQVSKRRADDPSALLNHIISRIPLGKSLAERHAGWAALVAVGSGLPAEFWHGEISEALSGLGWRSSGGSFAAPPAHSPTLHVLSLLAGFSHRYWEPRGADPAVATVARIALNP